MKIACVGDLHIGVPRRLLAERVLTEVVDAAVAREVDVILFPGDLFDSTPTPAGMLFLRGLLGRIPPHIRVVIIDGNHDAPLVLSIVDAFGARDAFSGDNVTVRSEPGVVDLDVGEDVLRVVCLPELRATWLKKKMAETPGATALDVARATLDDLGQRVAGSKSPVLFMGHLTIGGARMDNDQPARTPELAFTLQDLKRVPALAYVLGHVHVAQDWDLDGAIAFYTGAPFGNTWGELGQKTWSLLTWNGSSFDLERIPTTAPRLVLLSGTWTRTGDVTGMSLAYHEVHKTDRTVSLEDLAGAEVQIRYDVPSDDKSACERAAKAHRAAILEAGALLCDLDPRAVVTARSRAVDLADARTIPEKIEAYWIAKNERPDPERRDRIRSIVARHEANIPPSPPVSLVRVDSVSWKNVGKLVTEGSLKPTDGVRVVLGPNEAGKSTLLSLFYVGMWRDGPKGSLTSLANGDTPWVCLDLTTSKGSWTLEQESNKSTVWEGSEPIVAGRSQVLDWARKNLPSRDVLEHTSFLPSEGKGLLGIRDAELKRALLTLSGATVYASLSGLVVEEAKEARATTKSLSDTIARAGNPHASLQTALSALDDQTRRAAAIKLEKLAVEEANDLHAQHASKRDALATAQADLEGVTRRITEAEAVIADSSADVTLAVEHEHLEKLLSALRSDARMIATKETALSAERGRLEAQAIRAQGQADHHREHAARLAERLAERHELEEAQRQLPDAEERAARAEDAVQDAVRAQEASAPRAAIQGMVNTAKSAQTAMDPDDVDRALEDIVQRGETALANTPRTASAAVSLAMAHRSSVQLERDALAEQARRLSVLDDVEREHTIAEQNAEAQEETLFLLSAQLQQIEEQAEELSEEAARVEHQIAIYEPKREHLAAIVAKARDHEVRGRQAVGEVRVLTAQRDKLEEQVSELRAEEEELAAKVTLIEVTWMYESPSAKRALRLQLDLGSAEREIGRLEARVASFRTAVERLDADRAALALAERTEGDLEELLRVLSPKCIQAFEADAIGTEIADLATTLFQRHGFRWTLSYVSLRGDVEQARWMLTDLDSGKTFDARAKGGGASDGQAFIVMTAIFWAAREAVCRRGGGVDGSTVYLDEMAGAVREHNVQRWLNMMRDGLARTRGKSFLFIPPNDTRLIDACDGVVSVSATYSGSVVT